MCAAMLGCVGEILSHTHFYDVNSIKIQNLETASSENTTFESLRRLPLLNQFKTLFFVCVCRLILFEMRLKLNLCFVWDRLYVWEVLHSNFTQIASLVTYVKKTPYSRNTSLFYRIYTETSWYWKRIYVLIFHLRHTLRVELYN